jgi:hypothetical protein
MMGEGCGGGRGLLLVGLSNGSLNMYDSRCCERSSKPRGGLVCSLTRLFSHALHNPHISQEWSVASLLGHNLDTCASASAPVDSSWLGAPAVTHLQLSPNGRKLASMDAEGVLSVFDLRKLGVAVNWYYYTCVAHILHLRVMPRAWSCFSCLVSYSRACYYQTPFSTLAA